MAISVNNYYDPYMDRPRNQREYEEMKQMMYAQQQAAMAAQRPSEPEKPKHLNPKLLLTKGA